MIVEATGQFIESDSWGEHLYQLATNQIKVNNQTTHLVAIPYYTWGNRGIGGMRVWIPQKST